MFISSFLSLALSTIFSADLLPKLYPDKEAATKVSPFAIYNAKALNGILFLSREMGERKATILRQVEFPVNAGANDFHCLRCIIHFTSIKHQRCAKN